MINTVILVGRAGRDAELRNTTSGTPVVNFSIATTEARKNKQTNEYEEETDWHNITAWQNTDYAKTIKKGDLVYIQGKAKTRKYQDSNGNDKISPEVVISFGGKIQVLQRKDSPATGATEAQGGQPDSKPEQSTYSQSSDALDDDIPF